MLSLQNNRRSLTKQEAQHTAQEMGIPWDAVQAAYTAITEGERLDRERQDEVRQVAWQIATGSTPGCWPFWRHGFRSRWGKRYDLSDCTVVPGYDEIHDQIARRFPEYAGSDGEWRLFEFLFSPYERRQTTGQRWQAAIEWAFDELLNHTGEAVISNYDDMEF